MSDLKALEEIGNKVRSYASDLGTLNDSTEADFLAIGEHLRSVSACVGEISEKARTAASAIGCLELEENVVALQRLFNQMEDYLKISEDKVAHSIETLINMLKTVEEVEAPVSGFKRIVKHLRMLSISTKIESARLLFGDGSFSDIADDVERLSALISSKSTDILNAVKSFHRAVNETLSKVRSMETWEHGQALAMVDRTMTILSSVSEKRALAPATALHVSGASDEIKLSIGEIVQSLQFHDITRQQIEHATEALKELDEKVSDLKKREDGSLELKDLYAVEVLELQVNQLTDAKREFLASVGEVLKNLEAIGSKSSEISKETAMLVGIAGMTGASFLAGLRADVEKILSSLEENGKTNRELAAAVDKVARTIEDLSGFVGDIEEVGQEIELIALNSQIKSAKTGAEGAALGVLAEAVRSLSDRSRNETRAVSETLTRVSRSAEWLGEDRTGRDEEIKLKDMVDQMTGLLDSFMEMDRRISNATGRIEEMSLNLATGIERVVSAVTVHDRVERALGEVIAGLKEEIEEARRLGLAGDSFKKTEYLKQLEKRYTMHKERHVHTKSLGVPVVNAAFQDSNASLGDNVELF